MDEVYKSAQLAHKAGHLDKAVSLYEQAIALNQEPCHASYLLGCLYMERGELELASPYIKKAIEGNTKQPTYCEAMGVLHERMSQDEIAETYFRKALSLPKARAETYTHLGNILLRRHDGAGALEIFKKALKLFGTTRNILVGVVESCAELGRSDEALKMISLAKRRSLFSEELANRLEVRVARMVKDQFLALEKAEKWVAQDPENIEALNAHSIALMGLDRVKDAIKVCLKTIEIDQTNAEALGRLAFALSRMNRFAESVRYYVLALKANPEQKKQYGGLSYSLYKTSSKGIPENLPLAEHYGRLMYELEPESLRTNTALASIYFAMNRIREGSEYFDMAVKAVPDKHNTSSSRLFHDNYVWFLSREEQYDRHLSWARATRKRLGKPKDKFSNKPDPERKLRIGFSSADFAFHPVSYFFNPVFTALKEHFEVCLYSNRSEADEDELTRIFKAHAHRYVDVSSMSEREMADQIVEDGVDVLFDLSGHTSGNKLECFALRAAPVQVEWLGYPNTTGLDTMDYRLSDSITEPEGEADRFSSEKIIRLEGGFHLYRPNYQIPSEVGPSPFLRNGYITFGSFNNLKKVSPESIAAWADLIRAVPKSRILLKDRALDCRVNRERMMSLFASYGVSPSRVIINGMIKNNFDHLRLYTQVDIALDSVPYNGTTTTCEALIMGCPVLTIVGDRHASRVSASLVTNTGHPEWVASDRADFVRIGTELAADKGRLSQIRDSLRKEMLDSPLCSVQRMEDEMVRAIRHMWREWCKSQSKGHSKTLEAVSIS
ncbi:MAG: tetratricopeptide repeat protein [Opitutales bacterium]|nr:tetratricopeptide repeat protein [Opitutales bacterium]